MIIARDQRNLPTTELDLLELTDFPASWDTWMHDIFGYNPRLEESLLQRRDLLRIGSLSIAATALPGSLLAGRRAPRGTAKSVIMLWMAGGVTHIDSFDPKPDAPVEVRGVLTDQATSLAGVRFCETLPQLSQVAHKLSILRSYSHDSNDHLKSQAYTLSGRKVTNAQLFSEPNIGCIVSQQRGPSNGLPGYIAIPGITRPGPPPNNLFVSGWLGSEYLPYCLGGVPSEPDFTASDKLDDPPSELEDDLTPRSLALSEEMSQSRLQRRAGLRDQLDRTLRRLDNSQQLAALEGKYQGALRLLMTPSIRDAFDLNGESEGLRQQYGRTKLGGRCLMARRLVEAGARFVMVDYGYDSDYGNIWDNHNAPSQNHPPIQQMVKRGYHLAGMDRAFAALVNDLDDRGLLDSTLVVFLTEFGRTPRINKAGGRDHWGAAGSLFFAGGGVKRGQVVGQTDGQAAEPITHPCTPADVAATMYSALGSDSRGWIMDIQDRPRQILEHGRAIGELF